MNFVVFETFEIDPIQDNMDKYHSVPYRWYVWFEIDKSANFVMINFTIIHFEDNLCGLSNIWF